MPQVIEREEESCCRCRPVASKVTMLVFLFLAGNMILLSLTMGPIASTFHSLSKKCYWDQTCRDLRQTYESLVAAAISLGTIGGVALLVGVSIFFGRRSSLPVVPQIPRITNDCCGNRCNLSDLNRVAWFFGIVAYGLILSGIVIMGLSSSHPDIYEDSIRFALDNMGAIGYAILIPIGFGFFVIALICFGVEHLYSTGCISSPTTPYEIVAEENSLEQMDEQFPQAEHDLAQLK